MMPSYPKIYSLGVPEVSNILKGYVEVTEKIDGSQIGFGKDDQGHLFIRSKGAPIYEGDHLCRSLDNLFKVAVDYIIATSDKIFPNTYYYGEVLSRTKHNTLTYGSVPRNNIVLYAIKSEMGWLDDHEILQKEADRLDLDAVPLLFAGEITDRAQFDEFLTQISYYGNTKIEGVVIKNFHEQAAGFSKECYAKFVSEAFKEANGAEWKHKKDSLTSWLEGFTNEARWTKAIQHLRDDGALSNSPKDIGNIIESVIKDVVQEDTELIKEALYKFYIRSIKGYAVRGLPEWYKAKLVDTILPKEEAVSVI